MKLTKEFIVIFYRLCGLNNENTFKYFEDSPLVVSGVTSIPVTFRAHDMVSANINNYQARIGFRLCYAIGMCQYNNINKAHLYSKHKPLRKRTVLCE